MPNNRRSFVSIAVGLVVAIVAVYSAAGTFDFTNYDDPDYVCETVQHGLTPGGVRWAFTTNFMGNWHPLTWLSHMFDCQLFGLNPGPHHWINVVFHALNTLLLLWVLWQYTGALERSAFVAVLFAFHPLHVESVAWIAERKDVLSTLFWLLTMWAWLRYVQTRSARRYLLALLFFALGLMSKPMLVTLPLVLLLLDYWPLRRVFSEGRAQSSPRCRESDGQGSTELAPPATSSQFVRAFAPLLIEKIPFFFLTAVSCVVTFMVQKQGGAVAALEHVPVSARFANAVVACVAYLGKTILPENLAVFYPRTDWLEWQVAGAAILLVVISALCIAFFRRAPYLLMGWLWYLGTLVPVIGLVQVGDQAYADRYTYVPLIGLFIAIVWAFADLARALRWPIPVMRGIGITAVVICAVVSAFQLSHWRNSETLFRHALAVTSRNYIAHYNLGQALSVQGRIDEAIEHYYAALQIRPNHEGAHNNLGLTFALLGQWDKATNHYTKALAAVPDDVAARFNLSIAQLALGDATNSLENLSYAIKIRPQDPLLHKTRGDALMALREVPEALGAYRRAVSLNPDHAEALDRVAWVLSTASDATLRNGKEAVQVAERACQLTKYQQPIMLISLATACAETGDFKRAVDLARKAESLATQRGDRFVGERARQLRQEFEQNQPHREA